MHWRGNPVASRKIAFIVKMPKISSKNLIMPYFVVEGNNKKEPVPNMPGVVRLSVDNLCEDAEEAKRLGINRVLLFGVCPRYSKDKFGSYAYAKNNIVSKAIAELKRKIKGVSIITDVCLCAYTSSGHCGILTKGNKVDNKRTLDALSKIALAHASSGADWVAPSAMAKNEVFAIRKALDKNGFWDVKILGYSAKFFSNFYGPFRQAADSAPKFGDRRAYQLDNSDEKRALKEIDNDIKEGADMVMVKPALCYLDIIRAARMSFTQPLAAYNTSGEYAFVKMGANIGLWQEEKVVFEIITSIKRAGADFIITYHAKDIAKWLKRI